MGILTGLDLVWCCVIPLATMIGAILLNLRWISRWALLLFVIFKMAMCIGSCLWILASDAPSDTVGYYLDGLISASKLRALFVGEASDYLSDSVFFWTEGIATGRLNSFSGLLLVMTGESFMAVNLLMCLVGIAGQLLLFRYLVERFPEANRSYFYLILFHPSLALWSCSLLKDTIGIFALGGAFLNINRCLRRFSIGSLCWVLVCVYLAYLYRPYILLIIFVLGLFMFWDVRIDLGSYRKGPNSLTKWVYINFALLLSVAGIAYFFRYQAEELAYMQRESDVAYARIDAGSTFTNVSLSYSLSSVVLLPVGIVNTLLRPFPWEITKANHLAATVENIVMLFFVLRGWFLFLRRVPEGVRRYCRSIMFGGLLVTCITASAIGLFTSNLGTISRYRIPVIPTLLAGPCVVLAMHSALRRRELPGIPGL